MMTSVLSGKYKKGSFLVTIFLLSVFFISAQSPSIKWSKKYKEDNGFLYLNCGDKTGVYTTRKERTVFKGNVKKVFVEKFSLETMDMLFSTEIPMPEEKNLDPYFKQTILIDGVAYAAISVTDSKEKKRSLYLQKLDQLSGALIGERKLVAESNHYKDFYGRVEIENSKDGKSALVWFVKEFGDEKRKWKIDFVEVNSGLEVINSASVELDELGKDFDIFKILLNDHMVYAIASTNSVDPKKAGTKTPNCIYKINLKEKIQKKTLLSIPDMYVHECELRVTEQGNINVCGLSSDKKPKELDAYMYIMDNKIKNCFVNVFDKDLNLKSSPVLNMAAKGDDYLKNLRLKDAIVNKNGCMYIVMERGWGDYKTFEFQDLYIAFVNSNGEMTWNKQIKRWERYRRIDSPGGQGYIDSYSVLSMLYEDKLLLIYNDLIENINVDAVTSMPDAPKAGEFPFFATLEATGKMAKTFLSIYNSENIENIRISDGCIIGNKIVFIGQKFERIATITLN